MFVWFLFFTFMRQKNKKNKLAGKKLLWQVVKRVNFRPWLWGSRIAMVQTGTLLGPLVRLVSSKVELYEDAGGFILLAPCKNFVTALCPRSASNRGMESRYGCRVNFDGGWGTLFIHHLLQKWKNHRHIGGDRSKSRSWHQAEKIDHFRE